MTLLSHLTAEELADMTIQHARTVGGIDEDDVGIEILLRECAARLRGKTGRVMVPTDDALRAGVRAYQSGYNGNDSLADWREMFMETQRAMLAAARAQGGGEET